MTPHRFGILLFPGVEELDFVGPWEMLRMWSPYADGPPECLLVAQTREPVECAKGMPVLPQTDFAGCPPLDALLVPGGKGTPVLEQGFVHDGPVWSSAGVSAGTDMMLAYIAHVAGDDAAGKVQLSAEYYPAATRYGRQAEDPRAPAYVRPG